jgi:hypothetical protein
MVCLMLLNAGTALTGCTHQSKNDVIFKDDLPSKSHRSSRQERTPTNLNRNDDSVTMDSVPIDPCQTFYSKEKSIPFWIKGKNTVITRLLKECLSFDGRKGYFDDSPWVAMGIPCTGGGGVVDYRGTNIYNPKIVSFVISTDCPMFPSDLQVVRKLGQDGFGLKSEAKLVAYVPFIVQYWELPGFRDSDVGFTVDLRTTQALTVAWKRFLDLEPLRVWLYGRENSWMVGGHFYAIEADLIYTQQHRFRLQVVKVKALNESEQQEVKARCEALRPSRKCHQVF